MGRQTTGARRGSNSESIAPEEIIFDKKRISVNRKEEESEPATADSLSSLEDFDIRVSDRTTQQFKEPKVEVTMSFERKLDKFGFITNIDSRGNMFDLNSKESAGAGNDGTGFQRKERHPTLAEIQTAERREKKWSNTMQNWERRRPKQLLRRLRKGVPNSVRGSVWVHLGGGVRQANLYQQIVHKTSDAMLDSYKERAEQLEQARSQGSNPTSPTSSDSSGSPASRKYEYTKPNLSSSNDESEFARTRSFISIQDTIERDIHRTYPRHNLFYEEDRHGADSGAVPSLLSGLCDPELTALILNLETDIRITASGESAKPLSHSSQTPGGQAALRRVLRAYSYYDKEIGYCQGMNFIAGMFLTLMSEEDAFWLLIAVMNDGPCEMRGLFGEGMRETHKVLHVAERLTQHHLPRLAKHFEKESVHVTMYATQWLMTQYTSSFQFDLVTRVWDCFLGEGWKIIYRVMLALLSQWQSQLLKMSFEEVLAFFRDLPERVDGATIIETALKIPLRKKHIAKYEKEWYAQQQQSQSLTQRSESR